MTLNTFWVALYIVVVYGEETVHKNYVFQLKGKTGM